MICPHCGRSLDIGALDPDAFSARVKAGIARARDRGVKLGRPTTMTDHKRKLIEDMLRTGHGIRKVAKLVGSSNRVVQQIKHDMIQPAR